jgi:hypothetical protein
VLTAAAALAALFYTNQANRDSLKATRDQQHLVEQGQITDRFSKAIEQLGSDKLDIRLGGIYALERIIRDSAADEPPIIEVLSAFVRDHAALPAVPPSPNTSDDSRLATDVQATLTVLGRRPDPDNPHHRAIDLHGVRLAGANLHRASLIGADLADADLQFAELAGANLRDANLHGTRLYRVELGGAELGGATMSAAYLYGANLHGADLHGADLHGANLHGANLAIANLTGADLTDALLDGEDLTGANLTGANLTGAKTDSHTKLPFGIIVPSATPAPTPT